MRISTYFTIILVFIIPIFAKAQSFRGDCSYMNGTTELVALAPPSCYGNSDGLFSVKTNAQGTGMGVEAYYFIGSSTTANPNKGLFQNLGPGLYYIIVENNFDKCRDTLKVNMPQPDSLKIGITIDTVTCDKLGSFTANVSGGTPPYTISWLTNPTTFGISIGNVDSEETRTVKVVDKNNCEKTLEVKMPKPKPLTVITSVQNAKCFGEASGNIYMYPQNGVAPYTYKWSGPDNVSAITADKLTNIKKGPYSVTINDGKVCSYTNTFTIKEATPILISVTVTTASCETTTDGAICVDASGGLGPFSYFWSSGQTTSCISKLTGGDYKVIVTDSKGCVKDTTIKVSLLYPYITTKSVVNTRCHDSSDGEATITPIGGTSPFKYIWSDSKKQTSSNAKDLAFGTYTVTTTDAYGCVHQDTVVIGKPLALDLKLQATSTKCFDSKDGSAVATVSGGNGNYLVKWCDGFFGTTRSGLASGNCSVTVTDDKGCMLIDKVNIPSPSALKIDNILITDVKCFGETNGAAECIVSGGTPNYSYSWNDSNAQILAKATNLPKGDYKIIVTDANSCSVESTITVNEPSAISITSTFKSPKCLGDTNGSFNILASGGFGNYTYQWDNGTASNTTSSSTNALAGLYNVTVTDANLCSQTDAFQITNPTAIVLELEQTLKGCAGSKNNAAQVKTLSGGVPNYTLEWSNDRKSETISGLEIGTYSLTITDANQCTATEKIDITELDSIKAELQIVQPTCFGSKDGQIGVTIISGGAGNGNIADYDYFWDLKPLQTTPIATDLLGNKSYQVIITDNLGCKGIANRFLPQPNPIVLKANSTDIKCFGGTDGTAEVNATGDNTNFSYQWSDSNNQSTAKISGLKAGKYEVTVTDDKNCIANANVTINEPAAIKIAKSNISDNKCNGESNGSIELIAEGGTGLYSYLWNTQEITPIAKNLKAGNYNVTVSDENACSITNSFIVKEPEAIQIGLDVTDVSCFDLKDGSISISAKGGTKPYYYSSNGATFNGFSKLVGLRAGTYDVYLKDVLGCIVSETVAISQPQKFEVKALDDITIAFGEEAKLKASYKNNNGSVVLNWSAPSNDVISCLTCEDITVKTKLTTTLTLSAKDQNGCKAEDQVTVFIQREKSVFIPTGFSPNADGENDILLVHSKTNIKVKTFRIFDRWGELIYEALNFNANDPNIGWNGTFRNSNMPSGSYVWLIEVEYPTGELGMEKGSTMLIR